MRRKQKLTPTNGFDKKARAGKTFPQFVPRRNILGGKRYPHTCLRLASGAVIDR